MTASYLSAGVACRLNPDELVSLLRTDVKRGLSENEAQNRLRRFGHNQCLSGKHESVFHKYVSQFQQPMILLLIFSALISFVLRQYDDAASITLAVLIVVTVAFIQEYRSERAIEALNNLLPPVTTVLRDGLVRVLDADLIVPGDIIVLEQGDRVPADGRLIDSVDLLVDESMFTGESETVSKRAEFVEDRRSKLEGIHERLNVVYMGSMIAHGRARVIVVSTGEHSEFGCVLRMMDEQRVPDTPIKTQMDRLAKQLTTASLIIIAIISAYGVFVQKKHALEMLQVGVSLAVAAIPEGLPIVVTVTLALGVCRLAKHNAVVKKLAAVETIGSVSTICADKTGTLTMNTMELSVTLIKSACNGAKWRTTNDPSEAVELVKAGVLCSNAYFGPDGKPRGQPTECAFLAIAMKINGLVGNIENSFKRLEEWPFSAETRWMAVRVMSSFSWVFHSLSFYVVVFKVA